MSCDIPSPYDIGLPQKFEEWRTHQEEAISFLQTSPARTKVLCAPTGSGKTATYMADALLHPNEPTCVVTESRSLQDQLLGDYTECGLVDLRGRNNYVCDFKEDYTCEEGYAGRCPYKGTINCPASQAEMRAAVSPLVVTNYAKWTTSKCFGQGMSHFKRVVFDEGHTAFDALARAMQITLHYREIEQDLGFPFPSLAVTDSMEAWKPWAVEARNLAEREMLKLRVKIGESKDPRPTWVKQYTHYRHLTRRLAILSTCRPADWVVEELPRAFQFDPISPGRYAESALLMRVPNIIFVSATIRPKTMYLCGQAKDSFDFREFKSDFDPKLSPIYWVPTMRVDWKADSLSMLWMRIDQTLAKRRDRNGIIHTVSFTRRDAVVAASRFSDSMFINEQGEPTTALVRQFKRSYPGAILVSPSVGAGFDFPGRECEYQIICKVPFPPPSKILKARTELDADYPYYIAMQKFVQAVGRGTRSNTDRCECFIFDNHFGEWFYPRYKYLAPQWFHAFYRAVSTLPQPPLRLIA